MFAVGRFRRHQHGAPNDEGTEDVGQRFHGVGHQGVGMSGQAAGQFAGHEQDIDADAQKSGAQTAFCPVGRHKG